MAVPPIAPPQRFVQEGLFLALPTGVPGWCAPLPPDECRITSLTHAPRCIYGVTAGPKPHVLAADYRGSVCYVRSMGPVSDANSLAGVAVAQGEHGADRLYIAANMTSSCQILKTANHSVDDVIQEPTFGNPPYEPALPALNATAYDIAAAGSDGVWVLTDDGVQHADVKTGSWKRVIDGKPAAARRFLFINAERAWYVANDGQVWQLAEGSAKRTVVKVTGTLQTIGGARNLEAVPVVDSEGSVALLDLLHGTSREVGRSPLPRVQALCAVPDGRIFGLCGDGIGAFFRIDPKAGDCVILGAVVATVGVRRYGFEFSCAIPGRDGEIVLGEQDRGGHLWLYYPRQTQA